MADDDTKLRVTAETEQVEKSLAAAEESVKKFSAAAQEGTRGLKKSGTDALLAIQQLEQGIANLRAIGGPVPPEWITQLDALKAANQEAVAQAGQRRAAQQQLNETLKQATVATGELKGQVTSLEDVLSSVDPRLGKLALQLGVVQIATAAVSQAGRAAADILKEIAEAAGIAGEKSEFAAKQIERMTSGDLGDKVALIADGYRKMRDAVVSLVDGLEDLEPLTAAQSRLLDEQGKRLARVTDLQKDYAKELLSTEKSLQEQRAALLRTISALEDQGDVTEEKTAVIKKALQDQLDAHLAAGAPISEALQKRIDQYKILSTAEEEAAKAAEVEAEKVVAAAQKQAAEIRKLSEAITGNRAELEKQTAAILGGIAAQQQAGGATQASSELQRKAVQGLLDSYDKFGVKVPEHLAAVAKAMGVTTSAVEAEAAKQKAALDGVASAFASILGDLAKPGGDDAAKSLTEQLAKLREEQEKLRGLPILTEDDVKRAGELEEQIEDLEAQVSDLGNEWKRQNDAIVVSSDRVRDAIRRIFEASRDDLLNLDALQREQVQGLLDQLQGLGETGVATNEDIAASLEGVIEVLGNAGASTGDLETALAAARGETLDLGRAFSQLEREITQGEIASGKIGQRAIEIGDFLEESFERGEVALSEFEEKAVAALDRVIARANQLSTIFADDAEPEGAPS